VIRRKKTDFGEVTYKDDPETREDLFEAVVKWFFHHEAFDGESVVQRDGPNTDAPDFLAHIADDILELDVEYNDE